MGRGGGRRWWQISSDARKVGTGAFVSSMAAAALGLGALANEPEQRPAPRDPVELQLLGVNDFHGRLESPAARPRTPGGRPVALGGAATLAAHLDRAERDAPGRTIRVHAGDMLGASPLLSSHFHDEPSVEAMNLMRFDVGTLGNHEFDEGGDELVRLLRGGHRADGRQSKPDADGASVDTSDPGFHGVGFPYVAANTVDREHRLALAPYAVVERAGVKVGVIGVTTPTTPDYLLRRFAQRFRWLDISDSVNRQVRALRAKGVETIVVLAHSGARQSGARASGEIIDETRQMSDAVDVVIAGHTHSRLNVRVPDRSGGGDKLVVQSGSYGAAFDRVRLTVDRADGDVVDKRADTPPTWADELSPQPRLRALVARYRERLGGLGTRVVGRAAETLQLDRPEASRGSITAVAARAQRSLAGADVAFVNAGNSRAAIDAGPITYGELFESSAYEHPVLRMRMSGAGLRAVLAEQLAIRPQVRLGTAGLTYRLEGDRPTTIRVGGRALEDAREYTVAVNRLLAEQREFPAFARYGREATEIGSDLEALVREVRRERVVD